MSGKPKWFWQSDNGWVQYNDKSSQNLEKAFWDLAVNDVKMDDERFVDLKNFFQRRYDDPSKIRPVKREVNGKNDHNRHQTRPTPAASAPAAATSAPASSAAPTPAANKEDVLSGVVFFFADDDDADDTLLEQIEEHGAFVVSQFSRRVTHVVCDPANVTAAHSSARFHVPVAFIQDSIKHCRKADEKAYGQASSSSSSLTTSASAPAVSSSSSASRFAAAEPQDDDEPLGEWSWQSDNGWLKYDVALNKKLEAAYANGDAEVRVDNERFIDIPAMLQKRYDDKTKRRAVRRVALSSGTKRAVPASSGAGAAKKVKVLKKGTCAVDSHSGLAESHHVLEEGKVVWDVMLNQTNVAQNNNKFYVIQLLEKDSGAGWIVWTRWGRVGVAGQNRRDICTSMADAKDGFRKKFQDKTGNSWDNRASFTKHAGKYDLVEIDYNTKDDEDDEEEVKPKKAEMVKLPGSKIDKRVADLITLICNVRQMNEMLVELHIDVSKMPLGKLSKKQINKGYSILKEVEDILNSGTPSTAKLLDCANRFYTLIPHAFGMKAPPVINSKKMVQDKLDMLDALQDMEIASKIISQGKDSVENPVDSHYKALNADLISVDRESDIFKTFHSFVKQGHGPTHNTYTLDIEQVFEVHRDLEEQRFEPFKKFHNRQLLWHGSRITNWMGILSQGLRIAPPEAPVTGYMFGKGVYFADCVSKSANYCHASKTSPTGVLLLCEVALGDEYKLTQAEMITKLPAGTHSCKGEGTYEPDPSATVTLPSGCKVPVGAPVKSSVGQTALLYNEFIVYDVAQICPRYLLRVRFNFK
eukprot:TRINITY_DN18306_c0_g1_i1.p1 TRINITY_DN18306_c0_g1~~TRINITY_DN18306_c0_g1_i1.p1  ORF type:complete len:810 (+),score=221.49 TRINITY_DN18306_c0_g1_i1:227-2656(+)